MGQKAADDPFDDNPLQLSSRSRSSASQRDRRHAEIGTH
jgi:hypothetical protein